jgi:hypothetical protein
MANLEHSELLRERMKSKRIFIKEDQQECLDLRGIDLNGADLREMNLSRETKVSGTKYANCSEKRFLTRSLFSIVTTNHASSYPCDFLLTHTLFNARAGKLVASFSRLGAVSGLGKRSRSGNRSLLRRLVALQSR